jgi:hypothetical protein
MLVLLLIVSLGLVPVCISWSFSQRWQRQWQAQVRQRWVQVEHQGQGQPDTNDLRYVEGVGYVLGDLSCRFNAISPQLRCAINPLGPCEDCSAYEAKYPSPVDEASLPMRD